MGGFSHKSAPFIPREKLHMSGRPSSTLAQQASIKNYFSNMNHYDYDSYDDYKIERELYYKYLAERAHRRRSYAAPGMYESVLNRTHYF
jgi:hypothetical protein